MAPVTIFSSLLLISSIVVPATAMAIPALTNPSCAPGGNFDLSVWKLQLPTGSTGKPDEIKSNELQGCEGYADPKFFFTEESSGTLIMKVPGSPDSAGCVTTRGSKHCRTELREVNKDGSNAAWDPSGSTNKLTVTLTVITPDNGRHGTAIGQVFGAEASKPIGEMYYGSDGKIVIGVKPDAKSGQVITELGSVPVGQKFTYVLAYENGVLSATIDGKTTTLDNGSWGNAKAYFKAGNYNQGDIPSEVHFHEITVAH